MRNTNTKKQQQLEWRRNKINELSVKGFSQADIARMLEIDKSAVSRDIEYLKQQANETIKNHIQNKLPYEYSKCISGLEEIIKESWIIVAHSEKIGNTKDKISSLALIKDTYNTKMDLLTNASLLQDSIKFVEENKKDKNILPKNLGIYFGDKERNDLQGSTEDNITEQYNQVF
jgi:predicted transcriptional regulator